MKDNNIKSKVINATKWASITEFAAKIVTPLTNMILARILAPDAFGVLATVAMIISFVDMFTDAGFQKYLVQHEFENENEMFKNANVAFWTNFGISIFLWVLIIVFSDSIAVMVGNPGLGHVISIAGVQLILTSFSSIQMALYRREFDYKTLFLIRMILVCIPFAITIPLALLGFSYWSLIIGAITNQLMNAAVLTFKSKWKPRLFYDMEILRDMISFSIWSLIESISIWVTVWVDMFVIGSSFNQYYLGLYKMSTTMVNELMGLIIAATVPVLFAALSRLNNDKTQFEYMFLKTQRFVSILVFPLGVGTYLFSYLAADMLLGKQWSEASTIIGVYALTNSILVVFGYYCSEVYRAKGKPKLSFLAQILHLVVLIPVCIISSKYGFWTFVYARSWIVMEFVLVHLLIMKIVMGMPILRIVANVYPTLISAAAMGLVGMLIIPMGRGILWSFLCMLICSLFYFIILSVFPSMKQELKEIMKRLKVKLA